MALDGGFFRKVGKLKLHIFSTKGERLAVDSVCANGIISKIICKHSWISAGFPLVLPWVISRQNAEILTVHYVCMVSTSVI